MLVIAISGWVKSGKDTAAGILINDFGFQRVAYADPLKENVARDFPVTLKSLHNQDEKELPLMNMPVYCKDKFSENFNTFMFKEFRTSDGQRPTSYVIDKFGQMFGIYHGVTVPLYWTRRALCIAEGSTKRCANPDYWVEKAITDARNKGLELVVISDLRYRNEVAATKMALTENDKLVTIRVNRFDKTESTDPSERDLDNAEFDYVVENKGTLEQFNEKIKNIVLKETNKG